MCSLPLRLLIIGFGSASRFEFVASAFSSSCLLLSMLRLGTPGACQQPSCSSAPLLPRRTRRKRAQEASYLEDDHLIAPLHKELFPSTLPAKNEGDVPFSSGVDALPSVKASLSDFSAELVVDGSVGEVGELISSVSGDVGSSLSNSKRLRSRKASRVVKKEAKFESCAADEASASWCSLGVGRAELCLDLTLPTGQSFRWKQTGQSQYTGVVGKHLISLRHVADDDDIEFLLHVSVEKKADAMTACEVEKDIRDYLNLSTSLVGLYAQFAAADTRFAAVAPFIAGARLLRQAPVECLYQFICSSNNHIQRIASMVEFLASQGPYLGCVNGLHFHVFPSLNQLAALSETQLRNAGFGYRYGMLPISLRFSIYSSQATKLFPLLVGILPGHLQHVRGCFRVTSFEECSSESRALQIDVSHCTLLLLMMLNPEVLQSAPILSHSRIWFESSCGLKFHSVVPLESISRSISTTANLSKFIHVVEWVIVHSACDIANWFSKEGALLHGTVHVTTELSLCL